MRARRPQRGYGEIAIAVRFRKEEKNEARVRSRRSSRIGSIVKTAHAEARAHKDRPRLAPIDGNPDLSLLRHDCIVGTGWPVRELIWIPILLPYLPHLNMRCHRDNGSRVLFPLSSAQIHPLVFQPISQRTHCLAQQLTRPE
jgi:hypothetical protein